MKIEYQNTEEMTKLSELIKLRFSTKKSHQNYLVGFFCTEQLM